MGIIAKQARRSDRFHFGFCNAFERLALESADAIRATPTKDAAGCSTDDCYAVMAGVHAAIAAVADGELDRAMHTAREFGLSQGSREGLRDMVLSNLLPSADDFTRGYLECALWASTDPDSETGECLDARFETGDIALDSLQTAVNDCRAFQRDNAADLAKYVAHRAHRPEDGSALAHAGHDFWLTRNRHGAGFWDRGLGAVGDRLSEAARPYGEADLYVGDDGKVHGF